MTTEAARHPDIEIYLKAIEADGVEQWLNSLFSNVERKRSRNKVHYFQVSDGDQSIPIMVVEKATGNYTSVLFESAETPWTTDLECARQAFTFFDCEVRCIASGWQEGDDPDEWTSITADGEQLISWKS